MYASVRSRAPVEARISCDVPHITIPGPAAVTLAFEGGYDDYFLAEWNGSLSELTLQTEEVMGAKWASCEEMLAMLEEGTFAPFWPSFIQLLFDLHKHIGLSE